MSSSSSQPNPDGGRGGGRGGGGRRPGSGRGRSRGGGSGPKGGADAPKNKGENPQPQQQHRTRHPPPTKAGATKPIPQPSQAPPPPPAVTDISREELERREQARLEEQATAAKKKELDVEKRKLVVREKELQDRTAVVREALQLLQSLQESAAQHAESREQFGNSDTLKAARAEFETRKKNLKADLKKCTAFVKKVKSGALYSLKPADVVADVASLNLSRYVEEVVAAILESRPKLTELSVVTALSQAMHARYADFMPNLLSALWSAVLPTTSSSGNVKVKSTDAAVDLSKQRRLYVRVLTDFMVHGLLSSTDVHKLTKCVTDWTGAAANYAVQDAVATVAFGRAAGFEVLGITSSSTISAMELIRAEYAKVTLAEPKGSDEGALSGVESSSASVVEYRALLEKAMQVIEQIQPVLAAQRAVPASTTEIFTQHCLGAYETLATSLVQTHHKLQKLEKRCEQDRLMSGQLTATREKGLSDAHKLCESLQKSVEALSDCVNQPVPHLVEEDDGENAALSRTGVEVWTKDAGGQGQEHLGPFDDEETRAFYCDIPDLLTTIPPALLGISEEEIARRKEDNAKKYGVGGVEEEAEDTDPHDVTPTSEAQLDAVEEGVDLGDDDDEGGEQKGGKR